MNTGEADITEKTGTGSRPLTVCTYPEASKQLFKFGTIIIEILCDFLLIYPNVCLVLKILTINHIGFQ